MIITFIFQKIREWALGIKDLFTVHTQLAQSHSSIALHKDTAMSTLTPSSKFPIDRFPVEIRIHVYRFADVSKIKERCLSYWKCGRGIADWNRTIILAAVLNDIEALKLASIQGKDQGKEQKEIMCYTLAEAGNLYALRWARGDLTFTTRGEPSEQADNRSLDEPLPWDQHTCRMAARGGHFHVLKWARENHCPWDECTSAAAASIGNLHMLKWSHDQGCPLNVCAYHHAAIGGHLEVMKWLYKQGCPFDKFVCTRASKGGHLDVLQWLHEQNFPWDKNSCTWAARAGHLNVLQWLHEQGCPWDNETFTMAAWGGHLHVLKWLHEQGCPRRDDWACLYAASKGHLEVLKWFHEQGCPVNENDCLVAAANGHLDVLTWLREQQVPWDPEISREELEEWYDGFWDEFPNDFCDYDDCYCPYGPHDVPWH